MKASPFGLKRARHAELTLHCVSSDSELRFDIPCRQLGELEAAFAMDFAAECVSLYVTGTGERGKPGYVPPVFLPVVDGQPVLASAGAFQIAALIWKAQTTQVEDDRYTIEELVMFMVDDAILTEMSEFVPKLKAVKAEGPDPLAKSGLASSSTGSRKGSGTTRAA